MGYYGNGWGAVGGSMLFGGGVFWILLIVLAVAGLFWFSRPARDTRQRGGRASRLDVLDERYARDELDREECMQRRRVILGRDA